jgi:hypothetical protein
MNGTRAGLTFYGRCLKDAWRSSWDMAHAWLPIAGLLVLYGAVWAAGYTIRLPGELDQNPMAMATAFIVVAWAVVFAVRLIAAPPRLYTELQREAFARPALPAPAALSAPAPDAEIAAAPVARTPPAAPVAPAPLLPLDVRLHDQIHETGAVDALGEVMPAARAYVARVTNRSDRTIRHCQLFLGNPTHIQVVSGPFDLAPGDHRDLPVLRVIDQSDEPHALAYYLESETWQVAAGQAAWLPDPGRFKVKVLSADAPQAAVQVELSCSATKPEAWTLVEAAEPAAARTGRKGKAGTRAAAWADAMPEPSSGD